MLTESLNSIIRQVERMGKGYSFEVLRAKILFNEKLHKKRKPRFNPSAFIETMFNNTFNRHEVTDHDITDNYGVDFSALKFYPSCRLAINLWNGWSQAGHVRHFFDCL